MSVLITIIIFSILIIVHELGHFLAARRSGVKVEKFAIGFGPPLLKIKGRETEFLVCAFPLGGYVKLAGDVRSEHRGLENEFLSQPPGKKMRIIFAGPLFNYFLALVIFWIVALIGFPYLDTIIGGVSEDYPAHTVGLMEGDKVLEVDNIKVDSWSAMQKIIRSAQNKVLLKVERGGRNILFDVPLKKTEITDDYGREKSVSDAGIFPYHDTVIGGVLKNYPAQAAGLKKGDKILEANGVRVSNWEAMAKVIREVKEKVLLKVGRDGQEFLLEVPVRREEITDHSGKKKSVSKIGIVPLVNIKIVRYGFPQALIKGTEALFSLTYRILKGLGYMIIGVVPFREGAGGPIAIFYIASKIVKVGVVAVLQFMAALNISLAIINLLPIPILDGGHLLFCFIEKIRGKLLSEKTEDILSRIGLAFIGLLIVFVFYNDIVKYGSRIWDEIWDRGEGSRIEVIQE